MIETVARLAFVLAMVTHFALLTSRHEIAQRYQSWFESILMTIARPLASLIYKIRRDDPLTFFEFALVIIAVIVMLVVAFIGLRSEIL